MRFSTSQSGPVREIMLFLSILGLFTHFSFGTRYVYADSFEGTACFKSMEKEGAESLDQGDLELLSKMYPVEKLNNGRLSGRRLIYHMVYSSFPDSSASYAGIVIEAIKRNREYFQTEQLKPLEVEEAHSNADSSIKLFFQVILGLFPPSGASHEVYREYKEASKQYMQILDLRAVGREKQKKSISSMSFSGLPYFRLFQRKFNEAQFQKEVFALHELLSRETKSLANNKNYLTNKTFFDLCLEASGSDYERAIVLGGLLNASGSGVTEYFRFFRSDENLEIKAADVPLLVRLIAEINKDRRGSELDYFTYPKGYESKQVKNYYFWSSAIHAQLMIQENYSTRVIQRLSTVLPTVYKKSRRVEYFYSKFLRAFFGKKMKVWSEENYRSDLLSVQLTSSRGARFYLDHVEKSLAVKSKLQ